MASAQPDGAASSTLLLTAAELGDLAALQRALADGASASVSTSHGTGALVTIEQIGADPRCFADRRQRRHPGCISFSLGKKGEKRKGTGAS